jgi:hypothetical protein
MVAMSGTGLQVIATSAQIHPTTNPIAVSRRYRLPIDRSTARFRPAAPSSSAKYQNLHE